MSQYLLYGPTNAAGSLREVLLKEDVSDLLTNLFPLDTPLQNTLSKVPMNSVFKEYPVDTFANILRDGVGLAGTAGGLTTYAKPEGHTYISKDPEYPGKLISVAEIQGEAFEVSDTIRAVDQYAIGDRYAYEALKKTQAVVNNFEESFWWSLGSPPEGNDIDTSGASSDAEIVTARQTQGIMPWVLFSGLERRQSAGATVTTNVHTDGHGNDFGDTVAGTGNEALNLGASATAYDAAGLALDQTMFKDQVMAPWWDLTGRTDNCLGFCGSKMKNLFSQFALTANGPINERTLEAAARRVIDRVDWYETDHGLVAMNLCRYLSLGNTTSIPTTTPTTVAWDESMLLIQPEYFNIGVVRGVTFTPLGKDGDFERGLVRGEQALICRNPQAGTAVVNAVP